MITIERRRRALPWCACACAIVMACVARPEIAQSHNVAVARNVAVGDLDATGNDWPEFRHDDRRTGSNPYQTTITHANVASLKPKWIGATYGVFANAVVVAGIVYQADLGGAINAWKLSTGAQVWKFSNASPPNGDSFQGSPEYYRGNLYVGDYGLPGIPATFWSIDAATGLANWQYAETDYQYASFQGSPLVANGLVYNGEATWDEGPDRCDPRHQVVGFSLTSPALVTTLDLNTNGADIWSTPMLDPGGDMFVATGNSCSPVSEPGDKHANSLLRLIPGRPHLGIKWGFHPAASPADTDYDLGATPVYARGMVFQGGKDGNVYAVDSATGGRVWTRHVGEVVGSPATDGIRLYVPVNSTATVCGVGSVCGALVALNLSDGRIVWSIPAHEDYHRAANLTAPAVSQGIVFAGFDSAVWAFDAQTGTVLWTYPTGHLIYAGMTLVNGGLLIGNFDTGTYYCFTPNGQ